VYEPDTLENMRKHFAAWKRTGAIEPV
jgi:hypothetical protein